MLYVPTLLNCLDSIVSIRHRRDLSSSRLGPFTPAVLRLSPCPPPSQGGVILVSHDERLIRMVCKELWVCSGGTVRALEGGFDEYKAIVRKEIEAANANG